MASLTDRSGRSAARSCDRGAALVEFVITFPVLLLLLVGIIETAWLGFAFTEVWSAAREGARYATTVGDGDGDGVINAVDCTDIEAATIGRMSINTLDPSAISITYVLPDATTYDCDDDEEDLEDVQLPPGTRITVSVQDAYVDLGTPVVGSFFEGIGLDSSSTRSLQSGWKFG